VHPTVATALRVPRLVCGRSGVVMGMGTGGGLDSSSCLAEPFRFVVLTSLMSANIALNLLWPLSQRMH
jgi:hypothetical protein